MEYWNKSKTIVEWLRENYGNNFISSYLVPKVCENELLIAR